MQTKTFIYYIKHIIITIITSVQQQSCCHQKIVVNVRKSVIDFGIWLLATLVKYNERSWYNDLFFLCLWLYTIVYSILFFYSYSIFWRKNSLWIINSNADFNSGSSNSKYYTVYFRSLLRGSSSYLLWSYSFVAVRILLFILTHLK